MRFPISAVINVIREDLRDRYQKGSIIKELVQNADDADATSFHVGWAAGFPQARHPLLRGPALFVLNNGRFTPEDASAIDCIGVSSKLRETSSIGKFGLGLKSIFHLCEAFVYVAGGEEIEWTGLGLVNPWADSQGDSLHPEWGSSLADDRVLLEATLGGLLDRRRWLCIWVPLRLKSHGKHPITSDYPGEERDPEVVLEPDLPARLAALLPLLRSVRLAGGWVVADASRPPSQAFAIELNERARRRAYPRLPRGQRRTLEGVITTELGGQGAKEQRQFGGLELWLPDPTLNDLKTSDLWPRSTSTDEKTGAYTSEADKADPHCAVCFVDSPSGDGATRLAVSRAVFLPVGEPELVRCLGDASFDLILHGYAFVDAGRSRIDGWDADSDEQVVDEHSLRRKWNRGVMQRGILPLILPALERYVVDSRLSSSRIWSLTDALARSSLLTDANYGQLMCGRQQWVRCLEGRDAAWKLLDAHEKVYQLPCLEKYPPDIHHVVFPNLAGVASKHHVTVQGWPRLRTDAQPSTWPEDLLEQLLILQSVEVFADSARLGYLVQFLEASLGQPGVSSAVAGSLLVLGRQAVAGVRPAVLRANGSLFQRFARILPQETRLALDCSKPIADAILANVAALDLAVLVYPAKLDCPEMPAANRIQLADAAKILEGLANPRASWQKDGDAADAVSALALQVVGAAGEQRNALLSRCGQLRLFRGWDVATNASTLLSWRELDSLRTRRTLFVVAPGDMPKALNQSLSQERVVLIDSRNVATVLFGEGEIPPCDTKHCIDTLTAKPNLSIPDERATLLTRLQDQVEAAGYREAVRYLLHGRRDDDNSLLLVDTGIRGPQLWAKLIGSALQSMGVQWRLVPPVLSRTLPPRRRDDLGLEEVSAESAVKLLRELGPDRVDCQGLGADERHQLLLELPDDELLRRLTVHEDSSGKLVSLSGKYAFLDSDTVRLLDDGLRQAVTIIRRSPDPRIGEKQARLVRPMDEIAAVELALAQPLPSLHWRTVMDALQRREARPIQLGPDLRERLQKSTWLPTRDGRNVAPVDVIYLPGLDDEIARLAAATHGDFMDVGTLGDEVRAHPAFKVLARLFPPVEDALAMLSTMMAKDERYGLGAIGDYVEGAQAADDESWEGDTTATSQVVRSRIDEETLADCLTVFGDEGSDVLPGWGVVRDLRPKVKSADLCEWFVPDLLTELTGERMIAALNFLARRHEAEHDSRGTIHRVHLRHLRAAAAMPGFAARVLPRLKLLNRKGEWKSPDALCCGVDGIDDRDLLDRGQEQILRHLLPTQRTIPRDLSLDPRTAVRSSASGQRQPSTAEVLRGYFAAWEGIVEREVIGGFLSLLGDDPDVVELARSYLGTWVLDVVREWFHWQPLSPGNPKAPVGGAGQDIHQAMEYQRFDIDVVPADVKTCSVPSLVGAPFEARRRQEAELDTLFVGERLGRARRWIDAESGHQINQVSLGELSHAALSDRRQLTVLLRESARALLKHLYCQPSTNLDEVWARLEKSEQLDIEVAQATLLEDAFSYMPQYGLRSDRRLGQLLSLWDDARNRTIQGALAGDPKAHDDGEAEKRRLQDKLRDLLENDKDVGSIILRALRQKIGRAYQYLPESIPFELFQNADDAVVELLSLRDAADTIGRQDHFVVEVDDGQLIFMHWGRLINQSSFAGASKRYPGYEHDLRKMLVLYDSDKAAKPDEAVTGKFGLGFKSVYLLTDRPTIVSGRLGFEVVGGIYPKAIVGEDFRRLKEKLEQAGGFDGRGTICKLPIDASLAVTAEQALSQFKPLAHVLLVFARRIKRCELRCGNDVKHVVWEEGPLAGAPAVRVGTLRPIGGKERRGLVLRGKEGALLLTLGVRGFEPLPDEVPTFWVTAPTQKKLGLGLAINGPFDLDVGRAQLAHSSEVNAELARSIGRGMGDGFCQLYTAASTQGWDTFCTGLGLAGDVLPYDYWESLWILLGRRLVKAEGDDVSPLARSVLWGDVSDPRGLATLLARHPALPTGLWSDYRVLTKTGGVDYVVRGVLDKRQVFEKVSTWPSFAERVPVGSVVSYTNVGEILAVLLEGIPPEKLLWLATALEWEVGASVNIDADRAGRLGTVITREFVAGLESEERTDYDQLQQQMAQLRFKARDGTHRLANELVIGAATDPDQADEGMRARFAPKQRILANDYQGPGLAFFLACRERLQASAEVIAEWALQASDDQREAVLKYILEGKLGREMAEQLRDRRDNSWLERLSSSPLLEHFDPWERAEVLALLHLQGEGPYPVPEELSLPRLDPRSELERLYEAWALDAAVLTAEYERRIYPEGQILSLETDARLLRQDPRTREAWLTLLTLGSSHRIGRTHPEQHRGFVRQCRSRGWMQTFSDPEIKADRWIRVLEEYWTEYQDGDQSYRPWMLQFISIYQFARWLPEYVEMLMTIERIARPFTLDEVTRPRSSAVFGGGGISAPGLDLSLGGGVCFVLRELVRGKVLRSTHVHRFCYFPSKAVRDYLNRMGCRLEDNAHSENSPAIHDFLSKYLGEEKATFNLGFDLALAWAAEQQGVPESPWWSGEP